ncbi:hypothetical protein [Roseicyclus elongatus]|uniref:hypothetical protein n=1 Tax=Roseicyclus elongatus TaxID=159346 RepID=UPI0012ECAF3B|nr:hypothetical protein [Roseibacterium elongatum]
MIQTSGESAGLERRTDRLIAEGAARGLHIRHQRLSDPEEARHRAVWPSAMFSVVRDGCRLGGAEMPDVAILAALGARA